MNSFKSFYQDIFNVNKSNFDELALNIFQYQAVANPVYRSYIENLGINPTHVKEVKQIPFLPISFFKTQQVTTGSWAAEAVFESSGTTGQVTSKHFVKDKQFYLKNAHYIFRYYYGDLSQFHILALLPSYLERVNSSLVMMAEHFIELTGSSYSGFYLNNHDQLLETIERINDNRKILLIGVSFALLDLAERYNPNLSGVIVMETGGMKGRRKEMIREELHNELKEGLNVEKVHSEYGMTELLSQAYSHDQGVFHTPQWMKIILRDVNDPFDLDVRKSSGGINIIDLANIDSCAFIETQDVGKMSPGGGFEVVGRFDNSDIRGCNLMVF
ncbi:Long-chain-fatty-acid--luciferin-component ligase [Fulvivirga imtechensis AK7]|uniref:Long-chain-fatty-acid--luciferin-component ligase n=1 Tax=Fulvivirga imtechensis AK7 TaxID=1237149 RepID=L8JQA6_9BACT|nr:long-chain-fatty-acid--luciferin-component ligase [Fulvivirga imtechensis]ELR69562.1 Long-chain-fatty-acid--luciferin-component ligase [Fulvivirga imtechensis AK7]